MDSKSRYLELERALQEIEPRLKHHSKESIYRPQDQFLKIQVGDEVIRTIKEEDTDLMWHAGCSALESHFKGVINKN